MNFSAEAEVPQDGVKRPILFITRSLDLGGAERQLIVLANGLAQSGYPVFVAVFYADGALQGGLDTSRVRFIDLRKSGRWDPGFFLIRLGRVVRDLQPFVIHGYLPVANVVATLAAFLAPQAKLVWGVRSSNMDLSEYGRLRRTVFWVSRLLSHKADVILVNSEAGALFHAACGYPAHRMVVVPNGIDTGRFRPNPTAGVALRQEWSIGSNELLVGFVGRFDPMKDLPTFLKAMALVAQERPEVKAVCVGDGPGRLKDDACSLIQQLQLGDHVFLVGLRRDMPAVYNAFDALCLASLFGEGFPNVVGEAMACGTPCIVTDVGDCAHVVGNTGVVVPPGDPEALAAGILQMLTSKHEEVSVRSRDRIVQYFNILQLLRRTEVALHPLKGPM